MGKYVDKYVVMFNVAHAVSKMPKKRRNWEMQLVDDFLKAIKGKQYECDGAEALMERLHFIAGRTTPAGYDVPENSVTIGANRDYGERIIPVKMYGFAQGYVDFKKTLAPIMVDEKTMFETGRIMVTIPFERFYDLRQNRKPFKGCYVTVVRVA